MSDPRIMEAYTDQIRQEDKRRKYNRFIRELREALDEIERQDRLKDIERGVEAPLVFFHKHAKRNR